jgi:hypothetical protein
MSAALAPWRLRPDLRFVPQVRVRLRREEKGGLGEESDEGGVMG